MWFILLITQVLTCNLQSFEECLTTGQKAVECIRSSSCISKQIQIDLKESKISITGFEVTPKYKFEIGELIGCDLESYELCFSQQESKFLTCLRKVNCMDFTEARELREHFDLNAFAQELELQNEVHAPNFGNQNNANENTLALEKAREDLIERENENLEERNEEGVRVGEVIEEVNENEEFGMGNEGKEEKDDRVEVGGVVDEGRGEAEREGWGREIVVEEDDKRRDDTIVIGDEVGQGVNDFNNDVRDEITLNEIERVGNEEDGHQDSSEIVTDAKEVEILDILNKETDNFVQDLWKIEPDPYEEQRKKAEEERKIQQELFDEQQRIIEEQRKIQQELLEQQIKLEEQRKIQQELLEKQRKNKDLDEMTIIELVDDIQKIIEQRDQAKNAKGEELMEFEWMMDKDGKLKELDEILEKHYIVYKNKLSQKMQEETQRNQGNILPGRGELPNRNQQNPNKIPENDLQILTNRNQQNPYGIPENELGDLANRNQQNPYKIPENELKILTNRNQQNPYGIPENELGNLANRYQQNANKNQENMLPARGDLGNRNQQNPYVIPEKELANLVNGNQQYPYVNQANIYSAWQENRAARNPQNLDRTAQNIQPDTVDQRPARRNPLNPNRPQENTSTGTLVDTGDLKSARRTPTTPNWPRENTATDTQTDGEEQRLATRTPTTPNRPQENPQINTKENQETTRYDTRRYVNQENNDLGTPFQPPPNLPIKKETPIPTDNPIQTRGIIQNPNPVVNSIPHKANLFSEVSKNHQNTKSKDTQANEEGIPHGIAKDISEAYQQNNDFNELGLEGKDAQSFEVGFTNSESWENDSGLWPKLKENDLETADAAELDANEMKGMDNWEIESSEGKRKDSEKEEFLKMNVKGLEPCERDCEDRCYRSEKEECYSECILEVCSPASNSSDFVTVIITGVFLFGIVYILFLFMKNRNIRIGYQDYIKGHTA